MELFFSFWAAWGEWVRKSEWLSRRIRRQRLETHRPDGSKSIWRTILFSGDEPMEWGHLSPPKGLGKVNHKTRLDVDCPHNRLTLKKVRSTALHFPTQDRSQMEKESRFLRLQIDSFWFVNKTLLPFGERCGSDVTVASSSRSQVGQHDLILLPVSCSTCVEVGSRYDWRCSNDVCLVRPDLITAVNDGPYTWVTSLTFWQGKKILPDAVSPNATSLPINIHSFSLKEIRIVITNSTFKNVSSMITDGGRATTPSCGDSPWTKESDTAWVLTLWSRMSWRWRHCACAKRRYFQKGSTRVSDGPAWSRPSVTRATVPLRGPSPL